MNIGKPKRTHTVEPVVDPIPAEQPAAPDHPAVPAQPVTVPAK
jgi:hypothetical protein